MAGELLAQVLLDIGRDYSSRQAEERALLRKEKEKLDEREYQKALREERVKTEKELIEYKNSEEYKQWEKQQREGAEFTRKQNRLLNRDQLEQKAQLAGVDPEASTKMTPKELSDAVIKDGLEQSARAAVAAKETQDKVNASDDKEMVEQARALDAQYRMAQAEFAGYDGSAKFIAQWDKLAKEAADTKFPPGPGRAAALKAAGLPPDASVGMIIAAEPVISTDLAVKMKAIAQSDVKYIALREKAESLAARLKSATDETTRRGVNYLSNKYGEMPAEKTTEVAEAPTVSGAPKLPDAGAGKNPPPASKNVGPGGLQAVDDGITKRIQQQKEANKFDQYSKEFFSARKTNAELQRQAASASPSWLGRAVDALPFGPTVREYLAERDPTGSSMVDPAAMSAQQAILEQQRAAAQERAAALAPQVNPDAAAVSPFWKRVTGAFTPKEGTEDYFETMTPAAKAAWFRSHNLGARVDPAVVAKTPIPVAPEGAYWGVNQ